MFGNFGNISPTKDPSQVKVMMITLLSSMFRRPYKQALSLNVVVACESISVRRGVGCFRLKQKGKAITKILHSLNQFLNGWIQNKQKKMWMRAHISGYRSLSIPLILSLTSFKTSTQKSKNNNTKQKTSAQGKMLRSTMLVRHLSTNAAGEKLFDKILVSFLRLNTKQNHAGGRTDKKIGIG